MSLAWLFPGQGSQFVGMGKEVVATSPAARAVFDRLDDVLGERLSRIILEGPDDELTLTANAQPALLATSQAVLAAILERTPLLALPAFAAGHSLGEYSALVAAGALAQDDGFRLVRARGRAMQSAVAAGTGAMNAVIGIARERLEAICVQAAEGEVVAAANFNAPGQIVIAGHRGAVGRAAELVMAEKGRVIPLKVSAPFHCALMASAAHALEAELAEVPVRMPRFPVVANFDARPNSDPARVKGLLVHQVAAPVRWEESVRRMVDLGVTHMIEIGPGKVLAGLVRRIAKDVKVLSVGDPSGFDRIAPFAIEAGGADAGRHDSAS